MWYGAPQWKALSHGYYEAILGEPGKMPPSGLLSHPDVLTCKHHFSVDSAHHRRVLLQQSLLPKHKAGSGRPVMSYSTSHPEMTSSLVSLLAIMKNLKHPEE